VGAGVVKQLLEAGAAADKPCNKGWLPLHRAVNRGDVEITRALLKADLSALHAVTNRSRSTPLHIAASYGHTAVVKILVELPQAGASLTAVDSNGYTPLIHATVFGVSPVLEYLTEHYSAAALISAVLPVAQGVSDLPRPQKVQVAAKLLHKAVARDPTAAKAAMSMLLPVPAGAAPGAAAAAAAAATIGNATFIFEALVCRAAKAGTATAGAGAARGCCTEARPARTTAGAGVRTGSQPGPAAA